VDAREVLGDTDGALPRPDGVSPGRRDGTALQAPRSASILLTRASSADGVPPNGAVCTWSSTLPSTTSVVAVVPTGERAWPTSAPVARSHPVAGTSVSPSAIWATSPASIWSRYEVAPSIDGSTTLISTARAKTSSAGTTVRPSIPAEWRRVDVGGRGHPTRRDRRWGFMPRKASSRTG
jgi:hypothetical protein